MRLNFATNCSFVLLTFVYNGFLLFIDRPSNERENTQEHRDAKLYYAVITVFIFVPVNVINTITLNGFLRVLDEDDYNYFIGKNRRASSIQVFDSLPTEEEDNSMGKATSSFLHRLTLGKNSSDVQSFEKTMRRVQLRKDRTFTVKTNN